MNQLEKTHYEAKVNIIKAMAHPSRLFIIEKLKNGEQCVNDLTDMIGVDVSTVSKHLSVLKNAGIVTNEKRGNCNYYSLLTPCILDFIGCIEDVIKTNSKKLFIKL